MSSELLQQVLLGTAGLAVLAVIAIRILFWLGDRSPRLGAKDEVAGSGLWFLVKCLLSLPLVGLLALALSKIRFDSVTSFGMSLGASALMLAMLVMLWADWKAVIARSRACIGCQLFHCAVGTALVARLAVAIALGGLALPWPCNAKTFLICAPLNFLFDLGGRFAAAGLPGLLTILCVWATTRVARQFWRRQT